MLARFTLLTERWSAGGPIETSDVRIVTVIGLFGAEPRLVRRPYDLFGRSDLWTARGRR